MADKLVYTNVYATADQTGIWGPYWINATTGVVVYSDASRNMRFSRTTNGGADWSDTQIDSGTGLRSCACWFDQETPGDSGTLIHVTWADSGDNAIYYRTIDISDGSQGTRRTVDAGVTVSTTHWNNRTAITKTVSGNIIVAFSTQSEIECYKSADLFATAGTDIADVFETTTEEDWLLLYPASTADDNDAVGIFWDRSANAISVKMYDDSGDSWTETAIASSMVDHAYYKTMDAAVRHSDSHILLAAHNNYETATGDLMTWDITPNSIASPTVTAKTNVFTDQDDSSLCAVMINQQNDDVYVAYTYGTDFEVDTEVLYKKSDDDMGSWGGATTYSGAAQDYKSVSGGRTIGDNGGFIQWGIYDDDETALYVNEDNDVAIAAAGGETHNLSYSDTLTLVDSVSIDSLLTEEISEADTLSLSDSVSLSIFGVVYETDTLSLSDSVLIGADVSLGISELDTLSITDSISIEGDVTLGISETDTLNLTDSVSIDGQQTLGISEEDTLSLTDSVLVALVVGVESFTVVETLNLTDSVLTSVNYLEEISETDTLNISDSVSIDSILEEGIKIIETLNLSDSVSISATLIEELTITETTTKNNFN